MNISFCVFTFSFYTFLEVKAYEFFIREMCFRVVTIYAYAHLKAYEFFICEVK